MAIQCIIHLLTHSVTLSTTVNVSPPPPSHLPPHLPPLVQFNSIALLYTHHQPLEETQSVTHSLNLPLTQIFDSSS